jgi:GPH family glycoside/pentoside/hexuronide:cation symporter
VRAEGAVFGLALLVQKASLGLAAAALGEVLAAIGYHANLTQSPETLAALRTIMIAVPAALAAAAAGAIAFYPVSRHVHDRILTALASRQADASTRE